MANALVTTSMYWSHQNHCGVLFAREVAKGRTDSRGRMEVPDGDWEVALQVEAHGWILEEPRLYGYPMEMVIRLVREETPSGSRSTR